MKKSRKIILLIICVIIIAFGSYGYKVFSGKKDLGESCSQLNDVNQERSVGGLIDCTKNANILIIKPGFVACNASEVDVQFKNDGNTVDDIKRTPGLIEKKNGRLKISISKIDDGEVIHTITVNSGQELSKFYLLAKGYTYRITYINVNTPGFFFMNMTQYKI